MIHTNWSYHLMYHDEIYRALIFNNYKVHVFRFFLFTRHTFMNYQKAMSHNILA